PSPTEGKTRTAINLASSLALAGNTVILIEADLRRPAIGEALEVSATHGTGSVLLGMASFQDALVETRAYGRYLRLLLADKSGAASGFMADQLFLPAAQDLVQEAKQLADYVIVDSPPLSEVLDALPLPQPVAVLLGMAAGIDPRIAVVAAIGLAFVVLVMADLTIGLCLFAVVAFLDVLPHLGGSVVSFTKIVGFLLAISWLAKVSSSDDSRNDFLAAHPTFSYVLVLFIGWAAVSLTWAEKPGV